MPNAAFTTRLSAAVDALLEDNSLRALRCRSGSIFSPVYRDGKYAWVKVMDSDGLLVARRTVHSGEGAAPARASTILLGVVVQSEDATSQTKPNPLGKASLGHLHHGVWVDLDEEGRARLDRVLILFVLPKGAAPARRSRYDTAKRNVRNAADMMPDAVHVDIARGASTPKIAGVIRAEVRPFLIGRGRPRSAV